ncbi:MAG: AMP-binding protein [Planctomycetes bacterium]|nr:AMP-binding protein [Planctomycetota bacterium]
MKVSAPLKKRNPLATPAAAATLHRMKEHRDAPHWNGECGDRIGKADLGEIENFREALSSGRGLRSPSAPPPALLVSLSSLIPRVERFRKIVPRGLDLARDWAEVPTTSREDLASAIGEMVPEDADTKRMVVHPTSGTTGHAVFIPHHPVAGSEYFPLFETALSAHGVRLKPGASDVGAVQLHAQAKTLVYATVHAAFGNSGYAKVNLRAAEWPKPESRGRWLEAMAPLMFTGNPSAYAELLALRPAVKPRALFSTAFALSPALAKRLSAEFGCPVIDGYSSIETGPLAFTCRKGEFHVTPHDVHVEIVDAAGKPLPPGKSGEICVSGGRNPYLPLLRYRTGDRARMEYRKCACGDAMPRLLGLEGRAAVVLRAADGGPVSSVDVSRVLREFSIAQHRLVQRADASVELDLRPLPGWPLDLDRVETEMRGIFGKKSKVRVKIVKRLEGAGGKVVAFQSELR